MSHKIRLLAVLSVVAITSACSPSSSATTQNEDRLSKRMAKSSTTVMPTDPVTKTHRKPTKKSTLVTVTETEPPAPVVEPWSSFEDAILGDINDMRRQSGLNDLSKNECVHSVMVRYAQTNPANVMANPVAEIKAECDVQEVDLRQSFMDDDEAKGDGFSDVWLIGLQGQWKHYSPVLRDVTTGDRSHQHYVVAVVAR